MTLTEAFPWAEASIAAAAAEATSVGSPYHLFPSSEASHSHSSRSAEKSALERRSHSARSDSTRYYLAVVVAVVAADVATVVAAAAEYFSSVPRHSSYRSS